MDIKAFKMDGLGNDFVIIDNRQKITNLTKEQIIKICDRNFIGCDQLILIGEDKSTDASLKFFNYLHYDTTRLIWFQKRLSS